MRDRILFWLILGFAGGILTRSFFDFGLALPVALATIAFALILTSVMQKQKAAVTFLVAAALFGSALGILRYEKSEMLTNPTLEPLIGRHIKAVGVISGEPDQRERSVLLQVKPSGVNGETIEEKILVVAQAYPKTSYGDGVTLSGVINYPKNFTTDAGREFDYRAYLLKEGIRYEMVFPELEIIERGKGNPILATLFTLKESFLHNIERTVPEPHAALLGGLVVGAKHSLGQKLLDDFRATGVVHIVVLSGYNVTIVADFIQKIFSFLPHYFGIGLGSLSIVFFALMTGATATTVRASIMALLAILARATGRTYLITRALVLAGFFMLLQNPRILVFDVSFQLSFLATLGLIYVSPLIEPRLSWVTERFGLREIVTATLATQLFVLPFLLYTTGIFSLVSLPANLLILPLVPATMLFGFLAGAVGFLSILLSLPLAWVATALLTFMLLVVEKLSALPFASVTFSSLPFAIVVLMYALMGLYLVNRYRKGGVYAKKSSALPAGSK